MQQSKTAGSKLFDLMVLMVIYYIFSVSIKLTFHDKMLLLKNTFQPFESLGIRGCNIGRLLQLRLDPINRIKTPPCKFITLTVQWRYF